MSDLDDALSDISEGEHQSYYDDDFDMPEKYREPEDVYDCGHQQYGLRTEYDLLDGGTLKWSSAILCRVCKDSIDNNPDDPREVFPSGTRED